VEGKPIVNQVVALDGTLLNDTAEEFGLSIKIDGFPDTQCNVITAANTGDSDFVMGMPLLERLNPDIDWGKKTFLPRRREHHAQTERAPPPSNVFHSIVPKVR
jgi:hypothetical protein